MSQRLPFHQAHEGQHRASGQHRQQHVHARFLRIVNLEGADGRQKGRGQPGPTPHQRPPQSIGQQHQDHPQQRGEGARGRLTGTSQPQPAAQQPVVEGRVDIVGRVPGDGGQVSLGQGHAGALVVPQALGIQAIEAQAQSQEQDEQKQQDW